jgi:hypothetical protein
MLTPRAATNGHKTAERSISSAAGAATAVAEAGDKAGRRSDTNAAAATGGVPLADVELVEMTHDMAQVDMSQIGQMGGKSHTRVGVDL